MKALIDTNIYLDIILKREPDAAESRMLLKSCRANNVTMFVAWHTLSNVWYVARKYEGRERAIKGVKILLKTASIPRVGKLEALRAAGLEMSDFEDALQVVAGESCKVDYIITRNLKDFNNSPVPAISPRGFLNVIEP